MVWREEGEKVGVTVENWGQKDTEESNTGSRMCIIEYSEIPSSLANAHAADGKLLFGAGNICSHYITLDFLVQKVLPSLSETYHLAPKKIPYYDTTSQTTLIPSSPNGVKLELFVFDVFPLSDRWVVVEADRAEEFAPVKNAPGSAVDSPDTARRLLTLQAARYV
ncbi:hypothetical protein EON65_09825 [archaeon]|nr:MAG: hypothetical protein EON65_09825 [archaeon]